MYQPALGNIKSSFHLSAERNYVCLVLHYYTMRLAEKDPATLSMDQKKNPVLAGLHMFSHLNFDWFVDCQCPLNNCPERLLSIGFGLKNSTENCSFDT